MENDRSQTYVCKANISGQIWSDLTQFFGS